jgi:hypothetical protein
MYDDLIDIGNRSAPDLPSPAHFYFGAIEHEYVDNPDPDHSEFLYVSDRRPLGIWFDPDFEHTRIGGDATSTVIGIEEPLGIGPLSGYELVPVGQVSRAGSILVTWDRSSPLASLEGDRRDPDKVRILLQIPEHQGDFTRVTFDEDGPISHASLDLGSGQVLMRGICGLLGERSEMIDPDMADLILEEWHTGRAALV